MQTGGIDLDIMGTGVVCAYRIGADGNATAVPVDAAGRTGGPDYAWVHLDLSQPSAIDWLRGQDDVGELVCELICDRDTPPELHVIEGGYLINLKDRRVDQTEDEETRDLGELRIWLRPDRIITARWPALRATKRIRGDLRDGRAPRSTVDFLSRLIEVVVGDFEPLVDRLMRDLDHLEDMLVIGRLDSLSGRLGGVRRDAIDLRRQILPKRRVLTRMLGRFPPWGDAEDRVRFHAALDGMERLAQRIGEVEERARQIQDENNARTAERTSRNLYYLTILSAILLPLTVVTGIWGMNMGGLPWADPPDPKGFRYVLGLMAAVFVGIVVFLRFKKWA